MNAAAAGIGLDCDIDLELFPRSAVISRLESDDILPVESPFPFEGILRTGHSGLRQERSRDAAFDGKARPKPLVNAPSLTHWPLPPLW